ncbi:MAG: methionyl-tRNA formyltransferase, partial [Halobacteria archaeon]|nr:methionyl-tRNA formyltransferase [Halobacteria archaeon]
ALINTPHEILAVYTQPDRPAGRGRKLKPSPVKQLALEHQLPVLQPASLKTVESVEELRAFEADVMVVAAYGLLLPPEVLTIPRYGCLNIHASLLPRWRGAAPIQRAILAGDTQTGITIMQMDAGLDTGAMLLKKSCPITQEDTSASLHDRLAKLGAQAIGEALNQLSDLKASPQDENQVTYANKLSKSEALLDWHRSAEDLARRVRAFNPWPVAQTTVNGQTLRIWAARPQTEQTEVTAGTVIRYHKQGIDVACGNGVLRITRLQPAGSKPMDAAAFLNGRPDMLTPGTQLGE